MRADAALYAEVRDFHWDTENEPDAWGAEGNGWLTQLEFESVAEVDGLIAALTEARNRMAALTESPPPRAPT